ncbi:MAG TPA: ATP-binding protein [Bacteroidia bacterium]|nr:ATP-binding protein [Bacteroidia bacterium]
MQEKILLVDDREDNLFSIETILEPDGFQFVKATSGREALKILLSEFDFALILMDVKMPNLNGFETAALIYEREKLRHIPIIFITAHNYGDENIFKGYRTGAVDYIYKPINPGLLRAKVGVFVELYKKNHKLLAQEQKLIAINKSLEAEINERKMSEEKIKALNLQLLQNIDKLEAANKDLDRFAFMASHDLQEPLRKIRTFSDRISGKYSGILDEEAQKYLGRIQSAAGRMQLLIQDILTFSKISTLKKEFVKSNLNLIFEEVLNDFEIQVKELKAEVIIENLPHLYINPNLMRPLVYNIVSNSLKYSKKEETPVIRIHSDFTDKKSDSKYCRIFFEDNGIGFDQKHSEQIFEMFKRLHNHNEYEGTGIGLALCKKIVEEHSGYISARSVIGKGSTFIISLPLELKETPEKKSEVEV